MDYYCEKLMKVNLLFIRIKLNLESASENQSLCRLMQQHDQVLERHGLKLAFANDNTTTIFFCKLD